jgi:hypothetical protein
VTLGELYGHSRMNDEIRTVLVRSSERISVWQRCRDRVSVSRVVERQDNSSVSSIRGEGQLRMCAT